MADAFGELKMPIPTREEIASFFLICIMLGILLGLIYMAFSKLPTRIIG